MRDIDETKAPLIEHLIELRRRLLISIAALFVSGAVCFYFSDQILAFLVEPLKKGFGDAQGRLVYTKLYEAFFVQLKVAMFGAFFVSFPITANQLWLFIAPGLYSKEKRALLPFLLATPILFVMGAALAYYVVMPTAFHFFLKFQGNSGGITVEALPSMDSYLSLVMQFILAFGISFLLPVLVMLLNRAGLVSRHQLVSVRRYVIVAAVIVAAVLTPPDVISQLMLAIPLILLYELALIAIWFTERREAKEQALANAE
ncbi:twin-arginine translocase subunit TatC [Sphingobium nicotianae]|uniref:Sec-independent protein translocase protein TatC n=1 Tax=Sphingobium nicotianae TaxID=2782607 RepID=A0A9X1DD59_9SPHN|nr:twin-arginine translocase subunit TatC [Sphingobium nicotianae]MBT2188005.1 twin-arginine translocase subunit TatC [Sphingobium nicotianae]